MKFIFSVASKVWRISQAALKPFVEIAQKRAAFIECEGDVIMGMKNFGVGIAVKNNVEAVEFYKKVFGLELGFYDKFPEGHPYYGEYQHAPLVKDGKNVFDVASLTHDFNAEKQIISFGAYFDNEAEVREAFTLLSEGGIVKEPLGPLPWSPYCATVIDKFGITWWISV